MERGVVISPYFTFDGNNFNFPGLVGIEPEHLKYYLLYWDKIDFPNNNIIQLGSTPEVSFLENCGVLQRTLVQLQGFSKNIGFAYIESQATAVRKLDNVQPGQWTIAQSGPKFIMPDDLSESIPSLEIELYNSLPSPGKDVSLDDILQFKNTYSDELVAFRAHIDELYLEITKSGDIPRAKNAAINRLEQSINELDKAATESWASKLVSGFRVELNIGDILGKGVAGAGLAAVVGFPLELGAAFGAVSSVMNITISTGPSMGQKANDFAYLCQINKELKR